MIGLILFHIFVPYSSFVLYNLTVFLKNYSLQHSLGQTASYCVNFGFKL